MDGIPMAKEILDWFMIILRAGVGFRLVYIFIRMMMEPDDAQTYKRHIRNLVIAYLITEVIVATKVVGITAFFQGFLT